jgi:orotidine-5'-phosphate decarboxylase
MNFTTQLTHAETLNDSLLCVGLDPDPAKFPGSWKDDASRIFDFCATIVDATKDLVIAFKPQIAYFAAQRAEAQLERLIAHIHRVAPEVPVILDAKRGDMGTTAEQYAREVFERYQADAVTLSPLLGFDSIEPYLRYEGKGAILLCRTSNPGSVELQAQRLAGADGRPGDTLFEHIARLAQNEWNAIGAQGGDAAATVRAGWRARGGRTVAPIIVSSSRAVIYASRGDNFAQAARDAALAARLELNTARADMR